MQQCRVREDNDRVCVRREGAWDRVFAFGDLFLEDIREYREQALNGTGITPIFPIWGIDTRILATTMLESGLRAQISCVDPSQLGREYCGRRIRYGVFEGSSSGCRPLR